MKTMRNTNGVAVMMLVLVVSMIAAFMAIAWQSRILLGVYRNKALSDIIAVSYHGESKANDILGKFLGDYPGAFTYNFETPWEDLGDGTQLKVEGKLIDNKETLNITAKRTYASTQYQVTRETETFSAEASDAEIVFSLDCTGSMAAAACADTNICNYQPPGSPFYAITRMDKLKEALIVFLDKLEALPGHEKIKIGLSVFTLKSDWMYTSYAADGTPTGQAIKPDNAISSDIPAIKSAVNNFLGRSGEEHSMACKKILTFTNVGGGLIFAHDYLKTRKPLGKKQIEILVTDGWSNQRTPHAGCSQNIFCPGDAIYCSGYGYTCPVPLPNCQMHGWEFTACALASTQQQWQPISFASDPWPVGVRDPEVDMYTVGVYSDPPNYINSAFTNFSNKYFQNDEAFQLPVILSDIFDEILESFTVINVQRLVPSPIR
ncbi:MAG: hypothetical protein UX91_C0005G0042 [Candidatus Amesbacteria bacterium GW2011_GWB1_47_19]|nr:MAG: hypothetical protein UW51_C0007G0042 [Candidatus Amesbacteria bacterium GW2011_GWA1_44_24]KKU31124.1 MAG: hypothetical protein UX46_C0007G0042 [Candidatus Amesbacteria bacterium GW2011_GWC1_46_24]KKU67245.1 MAG: hypothetical protein UX91_C0005G0042 [Candidatus Amesbacteria bacterium GW2011_GWB1_47_19]OGD05802.1 MAG: hypothetical protein A2379_01650 [Candidatus Amesbacteria bacterium RIFOXYB1_FULL_47_13]HBC72664.1 hypothetical protein [Candidatus Amesbacteria bacterium]